MHTYMYTCVYLHYFTVEVLYIHVCTYFVHRQFYSGSHFIHRSPLTIQSAEYFLKSLLSLVPYWEEGGGGGTEEEGREGDQERSDGERKNKGRKMVMEGRMARWKGGRVGRQERNKGGGGRGDESRQEVTGLHLAIFHTILSHRLLTVRWSSVFLEASKLWQYGSMG